MLPGGSGRCRAYNWGVGNPHECLKLIEISQKRQRWSNLGSQNDQNWAKNDENRSKTDPKSSKMTKPVKKAQNRSKKTPKIVKNHPKTSKMVENGQNHHPY